jgi:hypothetical protein
MCRQSLRCGGDGRHCPWHQSAACADVAVCAAQTNRERARQAIQDVAVVCVDYAGALPVEAELHSSDAADGSMHVHAVFIAVGRTLTPAEQQAAFDPYSYGAGGEAVVTSARLALLVARSLARGMDGDLTLTASERGARFDLWLRAYWPGAPPLPAETAGGHAAGPPAAAEAAGSTPEPAPLAEAVVPQPSAARVVELTRRMYDYLIAFSDEVFMSGEITPAGATVVRVR